MAKFYESVFGWQMQMLDEDMGNYVLATTTETGDSGSIKPGAINGGFFPKNPDLSAEYPSVVIAVDDIKASIKQVKDAGGKVLGDRWRYPVWALCLVHRHRGQPREHASAIPRNWHAPKPA